MNNYYITNTTYNYDLTIPDGTYYVYCYISIKYYNGNPLWPLRDLNNTLVLLLRLCVLYLHCNTYY